MLRQFTTILLLTFHLTSSDSPFENIFDTFSYLYLYRNVSAGVPDTTKFLKEYDFIVIGAGSGGSVMANRLSENPDWNVLLLEAGKEENLVVNVPLTAGLTTATGYSWGYRSEPMKNACKGLEDGRCYWPKGRGLGGTSLINFLLYGRGHQRDYDEWEQAGNYGWSYKDVLKYFEKGEIIKGGKPNPEGYLHIEQSSFETPMLRRYIEAGKNFGYKEIDPNAGVQLGFFKTLATMHNGERCSASRAYLRPVAHRRNLHIAMKAWATKILIDPITKTATGVEFLKNKKRYQIKVSKEVILSAGAIASPQLLMLSGIGPRDHLESFGIPVIQDLKVGYNLQDHTTLSGLVFTVNKSVTIRERDMRRPEHFLNYLFNRKGPFTVPGGAEGIAFVKTPDSDLPADYPDVELVLGTGAVNNDESGSLRHTFGMTKEFYRKSYGPAQGKHAFGIAPVLMRPRSRGRLYLKSTNPFQWPRMEGNFYDHPKDMSTMLEGIKLAVALAESESFAPYGAKLLEIPFYGCRNVTFRSDDYWRCCIRTVGASIQHQSGTCKMGPASDPEAVVNPELQVHGVRNLRVVDASVMPFLPAAHTNGVVYMIGEKTADMVKKFWANNIE
ncbi:glucose dehydrogenase [FAD, quinone]-like [Uranotaenia lowii]|uniref:glucose dehydrogenase [FAD, quinone]-like n=1 Tax=Uranotaenia lowii TaxID=190385 RepID=UPI00247A0A12|nr:glucose dehydrogenase [FAD, quinone]-like [Uranotaenia lowii]XP_055609444.1 glucose dehydrogenase [FAD, quinone]-like [Uranotaenia lowii]